jgi:hypothetical protein
MWFVQVDREGRPFNGGTGTEATGTEAREAVEALSPEGRRDAAPIRPRHPQTPTLVVIPPMPHN